MNNSELFVSQQVRIINITRISYLCVYYAVRDHMVMCMSVCMRACVRNCGVYTCLVYEYMSGECVRDVWYVYDVYDLCVYDVYDLCVCVLCVCVCACLCVRVCVRA